MAEHKATIAWRRGGAGFLDGKYSREHTWAFDGGLTVPASSSPSVVRVPYSNPANIDPEEAYVASISSCHMLTFLHVARLAGFEVDSYDDEAVGHTTPNEKRVPWVSSVLLSPQIGYSGAKRPTPEEESHLHHQAHEGCFIAQSVKTAIKVAGVGGSDGPADHAVP
jgi:organic hydroperoxide reductase OsmC/OhrA